MVYCPPFHRLFAEMGRGFGGSGPSNSGRLGISSGMNGINGVGGTSTNGTAAEASAHPLVEATVEVLRDFVVDGDRSKTSPYPAFLPHREPTRAGYPSIVQ